MIPLARAPFLPVLAGLTMMLALSSRAAPWVLPWIALLTTAGVLLCSFSIDLKGQWRVAALTLVLSFLFASWLAFSLNRRPDVPASVSAIGTVFQTRPWGRFYLAAVETPQGSFILRTPHENLTDGDRVRVEGALRPFDGAPHLPGDSPSGFHAGRYWLARGVTAEITSPRFERLPDKGWNIHRWRHELRRLLVIHTPRLTGAYLDAAWTGRRDAELENAHRVWGTSHLLAISGFHVGVVMGAASFVFRRGRASWLTFLLWFYVLLTGASVGALRAALMIQVALLGELFGRPASAVNSVSLAAVLLLSLSPFWFWDVGWRLSILGAFTIAVYLERGSTRGLGWLCVSPLIGFVTFPQAAGTFGSVPAAGLPINLVAPPFFGFALSIASGVALLALLGVPGAALLLNAVEGVFLLWGVLADAVARLVPWQVEWNFYLAYVCVFFSAMSLCRAFFIPWVNTAALTSLAALVYFCA